MQAYREGDATAQEELLADVERILQSYVHHSMGDQLKSLEESTDLSQSLLFGFHMALSKGKVELENEGALRAYLRTMVRNKLANQSDAMKAAKRGKGKLPASLDDEQRLNPPVDNITASVTFRLAEMQERIRQELSPDEEAILEGRLVGRSYPEIAQDLGKSPDAVRVMWGRARERLRKRGLIPGADL